MENFIRDEGSKYNEGIMLDEYQGVLSIVNAQEGKDGKVYPRWIFPQGKDRKPAEKADGSLISVPWKITLGEPHVALAKLKTLISMIEADLGLPGDDPEGDLPF